MKLVITEKQYRTIVETLDVDYVKMARNKKRLFNKKDKLRRKQGLWFGYYENGYINFKTYFLNDEPINYSQFFKSNKDFVLSSDFFYRQIF